MGECPCCLSKDKDSLWQLKVNSHSPVHL